eukprot:746251-Hanusia_phi.AAC.3
MLGRVETSKAKGTLLLTEGWGGVIVGGGVIWLGPEPPRWTNIRVVRGDRRGSEWCCWVEESRGGYTESRACGGEEGGSEDGAQGGERMQGRRGEAREKWRSMEVRESERGR